MKDNSNCISCKSFPNSVFSCMGRPGASAWLNERSIMLSFKKDQEIFSEGTTMKGVYCIQKGKVKVYKSCHERNFVIELVGDSDFIGYTALFNGNKHTNSAKCLDDTQLCFIPKNIFIDMLEKNGDLTSSLLKLSMKENRRISNLLVGFKCSNMLGRIATALLEVGDKYGFDENQYLNVRLTRKDVGELSGTTTESVIRIMNDLKKEKVLSMEGSNVKIINKGKLIEYQTSRE